MYVINESDAILIIIVSFVCSLAFASTLLITSYSWNPRHQWKLKIACLSTLAAGFISFIGIVVHIHSWNMFGVLTGCSCMFSFVLFVLHLQFDRYLVRKYINNDSSAGPENSFVPSSAGISLCQLQLLLLSSVTSWFLTLSALLFFILERQPIEYDRWIYFCVSYLTTIGSPDIVLTSLAAQLFFPVFSITGLLLFGMVLVVIRRAILEWITLRVSSRVYDVLRVWAIDRDIGLRLTTPEQVWRSINTSAHDQQQQVQMTTTTVSTATTSPISIPLLASELKRFRYQGFPAPQIESLPSRMSITDDSTPCNGFTWQHPTASTISQAFFPNERKHDSSRPPHISTIFQSEVNNSDIADRTVPPLRRKRIRTLMRAPTISSLAIHTPFHDYSESPLDHATSASNDPVTSLQLYNLLQSTLLWQFTIALMINIACFIVFTCSIAYFEELPITEALVFCFGAITTMGSPFVLSTRGGRIIFLGAILMAMGLLIYLGSIIAELLSNQWRIHVETIECFEHDANPAD